MQVLTTTLEMLRPPDRSARPLPEGAHLARADGITPEYARFLYGLVGGPWHWTGRLGWIREQWAAELAVPGTEFWVLYGDGVPWGYLHLRPTSDNDDGDGDGGTHVQLQQLGLVTQAIGRGLGGPLLERGVEHAWSLPERTGLSPVTRVWVRTCALDGPTALANYRARGFVVCRTEQVDREVSPTPPGSWVSTGGAAS